MFDQDGVVGLSLEGSETAPLMHAINPVLDGKKAVVFDDLLGGNDLTEPDGIGMDTDPADWRALQIAWNFEVDPYTVKAYRLSIRTDSAKGFQPFGQIHNGRQTYFWWTQDQKFDTLWKWDEGPLDGQRYQFRIEKVDRDGSRDTLETGWIQYQVEEQEPPSAALAVTDGWNSMDDVSGTTDFDPAEAIDLSVMWDEEIPGPQAWDLYVQPRWGGFHFLSRLPGESSRFDWAPYALGINPRFILGPQINQTYNFKAVRLDGQLGPDDVLKQAGSVGINIEGGSPVDLAGSAVPNLEPGQIAVYDDLLGGDDLAGGGDHRRGRMAGAADRLEFRRRSIDGSRLPNRSPGRGRCGIPVTEPVTGWRAALFLVDGTIQLRH